VAFLAVNCTEIRVLRANNVYFPAGGEQAADYQMPVAARGVGFDPLPFRLSTGG